MLFLFYFCSKLVLSLCMQFIFSCLEIGLVVQTLDNGAQRSIGVVTGFFFSFLFPTFVQRSLLQLCKFLRGQDKQTKYELPQFTSHFICHESQDRRANYSFCWPENKDREGICIVAMIMSRFIRTVFERGIYHHEKKKKINMKHLHILILATTGCLCIRDSFQNILDKT